MLNSFDSDVARDVGINAAVIYFNIQFWCEHNRTNETNFYDGYYWTYNSTKAFMEQFPYMSKDQINYALKKLEDSGYIKTGNYNKSTYDRTKWFADIRTNADGKSIHSISEYSEMDFGNSPNGFRDNPKPIPDINTNINQIETVKEKKEKKFDIDEILDSVEIIKNDSELKKAFLDFLEMRKKIKHPITTERGLKLAINEAYKCGHGDPRQMVDVINQSIMNSYRGIFPMKDTNTSPNAPNSRQNARKSTMQQLDDMLNEEMTKGALMA